MKTKHLLTAFACLLACLSWAHAQESIYTDLAEKSCKTLTVNEETQSSREVCPGVGGYKLEVLEDDLRQTIDVVAPNGKKSSLDLQSNVSSAFSSLGAKAEWRVKRKGAKVTPFALIVRFNASEDPEDSTKKTSYLVVVKISPKGSCVTDVVNPSPDANAQAQRLADAAANKPCKKSEEE